MSPAAAQGWSGPFQLTNDTFADINPSACREWLSGSETRLVWQSNRNSDWDIYSRLCHFYNGSGWEDEMPVCTDSGDDITPAIAARFDVMDGWVYWCVWERRESPVSGRIMAASATASDSAWSAPVEIGRCLHTSGDSARPFIMTIEQSSSDTLWAAWMEHDTDGWSVRYSRCVDYFWDSSAFVRVSSNPIRHARIGRGSASNGSGCPLLVWEEAGDIFYSQYEGDSWTTPQEVAPSDSLDRNPEVIHYADSPFQMGPWITWESCRGGDTAIYGTAEDTFSIGRRWCDSTGAGNNRTPCGTPTTYPIDQWESRIVAWASDRNGNDDIYSSVGFSDEDVYVDDDPANDVNPTLTTLGLTQNWCVWQSDRTGNWDLFGSYIYVTGVEEGSKPPAASPKPEQTVVRGVLLLEGDCPRTRTVPKAVLLDVSGRTALDLHSGPNDVSGLAPGVYFAIAPSPFSSPPEGERDGVRRCQASDVERGALSVTKVIVQR